MCNTFPSNVCVKKNNELLYFVYFHGFTWRGCWDHEGVEFHLIAWQRDLYTLPSRHHQLPHCSRKQRINDGAKRTGWYPQSWHGNQKTGCRVEQINIHIQWFYSAKWNGFKKCFLVLNYNQLGWWKWFYLYYFPCISLICLIYNKCIQHHTTPCNSLWHIKYILQPAKTDFFFRVRVRAEQIVNTDISSHFTFIWQINTIFTHP